MNGLSAASLSLRTLESPSQLHDFLALPHRLYAEDPAWIAPLTFEQRQRFSPKNHFFQHARWRGWVAYRDGVPVGRITAQIDELHQAHHGDHVGYFGMIEATDDAEVFAALFDAAESWLRSEGMQHMRGPLNLHINEEVGLLVEGFEVLEAIGRVEVEERWEGEVAFHKPIDPVIIERAYLERPAARTD